MKSKQRTQFHLHVSGKSVITIGRTEKSRHPHDSSPFIPYSQSHFHLSSPYVYLLLFIPRLGLDPEENVIQFLNLKVILFLFLFMYLFCLLALLHFETSFVGSNFALHLKHYVNFLCCISWFGLRLYLSEFIYLICVKYIHYWLRWKMSFNSCFF